MIAINNYVFVVLPILMCCIAVFYCYFLLLFLITVSYYCYLLLFTCLLVCLFACIFAIYPLNEQSSVQALFLTFTWYLLRIYEATYFYFI